MKYFVYILKSLQDNEYYVGMSSDPEKRLKAHNSGRNKSTTRRRPFELIHKEPFDSLCDARIREKFLKSYKGVSEKRKIIIECDN